MTTVTGLLEQIQGWPLSVAIRQSDWAVMACEAVHLLGLALLGGGAVLIAMAALRRDGLNGLSVGTLGGALKCVMSVGLFLMAASGALIAMSMPFKYYLNDAFRLKLVLLVAALGVSWPLGWSRAGSLAMQRTRALVAFLLWLGVGICGRAIGFL